MTTIIRPGRNVAKEIIFQIVLHVVIFLFYSFDKDHPQLTVEHLAFFANYVVAAFIINYLLLPKYYYQGRYYLFFTAIMVLVILVMVVEEQVLEKIYFPDSRGKSFPGVIFTLLEVLPTIIILTGFKFAWDASRKQYELNALKLLVKESELQFLKLQINPHFLFNNLNNLYAYAIENSPKTPTIILELSSVLRYMLYDCKENYVPLRKEVAHLKNYTRLNELQIEDRGQVTFESQIKNDEFEIPPLILSVFVENAFKHSIASQSENITINIKIVVSEDGKMAFDCVNTFLSGSNTKDLPLGIGLQNVKKRLNLLYPEGYHLDVNSDNNKFKVSLFMQLKDHVK